MAKKQALSLADLRRAVAAGRWASVVVLLGRDSAMRRRASETLIQAFSAGESAFPGSVSRIDGPEVGLPGILDEARSMSLFAIGPADRPSRLVLVAGLDRVLKPPRGATPPDTGPLKEYLEMPVGETCLVFDAHELDGRTAIVKALTKVALVVDCTAPTKETDLRRWISGLVAADGCTIDPDAAVWLVEMIGGNIAVLEQELAKAVLFVGPGGKIETDTLERLTGRSREHSVFDLTDALVAGAAGEAMLVLNRLLDDGEHPLRVLPMIAWVTRQMVVAHDLVASGCPRQEVLEGLAGRWNQRGAVADRGRRARRADLSSALAGCADADLFVKRLRDSRPGSDKLRPARGRLEALCRQICAA